MGARFLRIYSSLFYIIGATTLVADYRYLESGEAHLFNQVTLVLPQYILFEGSIFYIIYLIYIYIFIFIVFNTHTQINTEKCFFFFVYYKVGWDVTDIHK